MFKLTETVKRIAIFTAILSILAFVAGSFFVGNIFYYAIGIILGAVFSILKLILLERTLAQSLEMPSQQAQNYITLRFLFRYILTAAFLVISAFLFFVDIYGVVFGMVAMQTSVYLSNIKFNKAKKQ